MSLPIPPRSVATHGFALAELMIIVVILGILAGVGSFGLLVSSRVWGLRTAAVELAAYLGRAQAQAAASTEPCEVEITGTGDAQQIRPSNVSPNACSTLGSSVLLPINPVPLALNTPTLLIFRFSPGGTVPATLTTVLSAPNTGNRQICVQVLAPSGLVATGSIQQGGTCDHAAFN